MSVSPRPTAIFCSNDWLAVCALNGAKEIGIDISRRSPRRRFDDMAVANWPIFDLTTARNHVTAKTAEAARMLVRRLESGLGARYTYLISATSCCAIPHPVMDGRIRPIRRMELGP